MAVDVVRNQREAEDREYQMTLARMKKRHSRPVITLKGAKPRTIVFEVAREENKVFDKQ